MDCPDTPAELLAFWGRQEGVEEASEVPEDLDDLEDAEGVGMPPASHAAIKRAAQRWDEFVTVTQGKERDEVTEAGYIFAAALGLEGGALDHAVECLKLWTDDPSPHQATQGLFFGLLIAEEAKLERELEGL